MAEHILGLLFVTSSSRGQTVFRYPPDPYSPHARLSQPIYPSATYTRTDAVDRPLKKSLFEPRPHHDGGKSSTASFRSGRKGVKMAPGRDWSAAMESGFEDAGLYGSCDEVSSGSSTVGSSSTSTSSSDSELDYMYTPPSRRPDERDGKSRSLEVDGPSTSRRGSTVGNALNNGDLAHGSPDGPDKFTESQYNYALSYSLDFLSDMLTPPRSACNRKFEINVDELVFIGHPVSINADGKWAYPEDDEVDVRPTARGRRARDGPSQLRTVVEMKESTSPETNSSMPKDGSPHKNKGTIDGDSDGGSDGAPTLNMFHLVLILDRPDPKPGASVTEGHAPMGLFDEVYREIAFKWTAAAYAMQVKDDYIGREAWAISRTKEKCLNERIPIFECCKMLYESSSLDRSLNHLFREIHHLQTKPANPLYANLPTTLTVSLVDVQINMILSPRTVDSDEAWVHWGEMDDMSSDDEGDSDGGLVQGSKGPDLRVEPWQTLLLVHEDVGGKSNEISNALVGLGLSDEVMSNGEVIPPGPDDESRKGSAEEDEGLLMKGLIEACDVTKPLVEIAHILRYDLDGIVIPLARELVQNKKAILIDVMNSRLRTRVMPTTISLTHWSAVSYHADGRPSSTLDQYAIRFGRLFPTLPPLPAFIAMISASTGQFREILPSNYFPDLATRQTYLDALVWLLKQDLVVQVHTRARIFAGPEVKEVAWRKLWSRRRERWLRRRSLAHHRRDQSDDLITPKPRDSRQDPMDATVPTPRREQSFMDYDPDLEMDSDVYEEDEVDGNDEDHRHGMKFHLDEEQPSHVPQFEGSFIFRPARAQKNEARWLRIIRETADELSASKFDLCVQYFDGFATFEEISYRTGLQKRELERILGLYKDHLVTFLHP